MSRLGGGGGGGGGGVSQYMTTMLCKLVLISAASIETRDGIGTNSYSAPVPVHCTQPQPI